ncbi:MAG TPA: methyltransferase domain-containing protein [Terriglobales bacterium]|jgi:ubiquinone/menaquinone biosynthesis C-methylase UbiE|nr:methyltransferase domain-containing protein [Terriglobales bacterium]
MRPRFEPVAGPNRETSISHVSDVREFWNVEACGSHFVAAERGTSEFYEQFRSFRYRTEWHISELVPFEETRDKKILEIGCGNGADGALFSRAGADYTGVDLTPAAVRATQSHFEALGLNGRFQVEDAEALSFSDESFDFVYSHGVLHHTPHPKVAFAEVFRVLKPGGRAIVMLYHKHSFNYYIRILGYMRARILLHVLLRVGRHSEDRSRINQPMLHLRGNQNSLVWRAHYANFLRQGWSYLQAKNFVHHATDGPACPVANVYTHRMVRTIFRQFTAVETKVAHFPLRKYSAFKWVPLFVERRLSSMLGWYLFVYLTK